MANNSMGSLYFGIDMAAGRQADSAAEIRAIEQRGGMSIDTGLPTSAAGEPTKEGEESG